MTAKLLPLFPSHKIYVEPFGGGASLLMGKEPSSVEVYNDLDSGLVDFFRVLRNKDQFAEFHQQVSLIPYAREEYDYCRKAWRETKDPVSRAVAWFVVARMAFSGDFGAGWSSTVSRSVRGMPRSVSDWLTAIDRLPEVAERLLRVQIEQSDFRKILDRYDTPNTFFYCDPPYIHATRSAGKYAHELDDNDHQDLVDLLLTRRAKIMLSGYDHPIYQRLSDHGWRKVQWETACYAAGRTRVSGLQGKGSALEKQKRTETVWMNYLRRNPVK